MLTSTWNISTLPTHFRCCFWGVKNSCFPGNAVHKAVLPTNTALNGIDQSDQSPQISGPRRRGLKQNESLSESFWIRWANEVKINHIVRKWKCFSILHACKPDVGDSQNQKYEPFITHNRGTLIFLWPQSFLDGCRGFLWQVESANSASMAAICWVFCQLATWCVDILLVKLAV